MFLFSTRKDSLVPLLAIAFTLVGATAGRGDDPPKKDDALDRLFEKLEGSSPAPAEKGVTAGAKAGSEVIKEKEKPKDEADASKDKPRADVAPKDQALDSLLEKLGETKDKPEARDERRGGPPKPGEPDPDGKEKDRGDAPMPPKAEQPAPGGLTGEDKTIDERLEELTGRKRKKKDQDEEGGGALSGVIKEMREVEKRLGEPDTGEETRRKQAEIVKNLNQVIEQLRNSSSQSKAQKKTQTVMQPGGKPGSQPGQTPGSNPGGAPNAKPSKPENKHAFVNGKDEWGHLPAELRQEMDNVAREVMLPKKEDLIRLYYLSVSKKSLSREE